MLPELIPTISPIQHGLATAAIPDIPGILLLMRQLLLSSAAPTTGQLPPSRVIAASQEELLMTSSLPLRLAVPLSHFQTASAITT
jgi:hypothetical protein